MTTNNTQAETSTDIGSPDSDGLDSRLIVFNVLNDVFRRDKTLDEAFESKKHFNKLSKRDRAFTKLLVLTILRRKGEIDAIIRKYIDRPMEEITPKAIVDVLRLGTAQLIFLEMSPHAAVDTCVEITKKCNMGKQSGFVNAVLRKISREKYSKPNNQDAGKINTPPWLWNRFVADYGVETTSKIVEANMVEGNIDINVKSDVADWAEKLDANILPNQTLRLKKSTQVTTLEGFDDGDWWVQAFTSSLPVQLLGDIKGKDVIDLCAAPGGKTMQLINAGAKVSVLDKSEKRLLRLEENLDRVKMKLESKHIADASSWKSPIKADIVLLDAPCSATGTVRHHPDVIYLRNLNSLDKLVRLQELLIDNAIKMLKPNGILLYCTCSLQKTEGEEQIKKALIRNQNISRVKFAEKEVFGIPELINKDGDIRALPYMMMDKGGMDGFFIAKLQLN